MNERGKKIIKFGCERDRAKKRFSDAIYFTFMTAKRPGYIFIKFTYNKTKAQKEKERF